MGNTEEMARSTSSSIDGIGAGGEPSAHNPLTCVSPSTRRAVCWRWTRVAGHGLVEGGKNVGLAAAVKAAEEAKLAKQNARCFGDIGDVYRLYMQSEGKLYDKANPAPI